MPLRKSKTTKAKEAVTDQVSDRTDDLMAALTRPGRRSRGPRQPRRARAPS